MAITVATGGSALPIIASVAVGTAVTAGMNAGVTAIKGGSGEDILNSALDGASDGFMWSGIFAFGGATINASSIGFKAAARDAKTACKNITNDVIGKPRIGSALKKDSHHAFPNIVDNYVGYATKTPINNNAIKYELAGSLNGKKGIFEWMVNESGEVFHRFFKIIGG